METDPIGSSACPRNCWTRSSMRASPGASGVFFFGSSVTPMAGTGPGLYLRGTGSPRKFAWIAQRFTELAKLSSAPTYSLAMADASPSRWITGSGATTTLNGNPLVPAN